MKSFEKFPGYKVPEFNSNSGEFHVTLWNLNYDEKQFANDMKETAKKAKQRKEFVKAKRVIYKLIGCPVLCSNFQVKKKLILLLTL